MHRQQMSHSFGYSFIGGYLGYRWDFKKPSFSSQQANPEYCQPCYSCWNSYVHAHSPLWMGGNGGLHLWGAGTGQPDAHQAECHPHTHRVTQPEPRAQPLLPPWEGEQSSWAIPQLLRPHSQPRAPQPPALSIPAARRSGTATPFPSPPSIRAIPPHFCLLANHAAAPSVLPAGKYLLPVGLRQRVPSNQVSAGLSSQAGAGAQLSSVPPAHTLLGVFVARRGCRCRLQARTSR